MQTDSFRKALADLVECLRLAYTGTDFSDHLFHEVIARGYAGGAAVYSTTENGPLEICKVAGVPPTVPAAILKKQAEAKMLRRLVDDGHYAVPLIEGDMILGLVVYVLPYQQGGPRHDAHLTFLEAASQVILRDQAVQRLLENHIALSNTDGLTGLYNHRYFQATLQRAHTLAEATESSLTVILMDIDLFKRINDHYGHYFGDLVLREVASLISQSLRTDTVVARYGGEEFAVLLPGVDLTTGREIAERLRKAVEDAKITDPTTGGQLRVTMSAGVASCRPGPTYPPSRLLVEADEALYTSKFAGRNRVTTWEPMISMIRMG